MVARFLSKKVQKKPHSSFDEWDFCNYSALGG